MSHSRMKRGFCLLAFLLLTACGGGGGGGFGLPVPVPAKDPAPAPQAAKRCAVEVYGDSIMAGNGTAETPAMVLHALRPELAVTDKAVAGTSLQQLAARFYNDPRSAYLVVIENGVIDSWQGLPPEDLTALLRGMVEYLRAEGRAPVLTGFSHQVAGVLTPVSLERRDAADAAVRALATELQVPFADWGAARFDGPSDLQDTVHPGRAYSDRLIERLALVLDAAAGCRP